jgi:hypothetical protein
MLSEAQGHFDAGVVKTAGADRQSRIVPGAAKARAL